MYKSLYFIYITIVIIFVLDCCNAVGRRKYVDCLHLTVAAGLSVFFCWQILQIYLAKMASSVSGVLVRFFDEYKKTTPTKLKLVDAYLFYILLTGVVQFVYCCLVGTFPFNSFLSGFISCVGSFVLGGTHLQI